MEILKFYKIVHTLPIGPAFVRPLAPLTAIAGETFTADCPAGGFPIKTISWSKGWH